jgi:hypothetical protein
MVEGSATAGGHEWDFRWQALTCDAAPLISDWFRLLATWVESDSTDSAPDAPWLIKPNLQFRAASDKDGKVELVVELDNEFLPAERRRGRQAAIEGASRVDPLGFASGPSRRRRWLRRHDRTVSRPHGTELRPTLTPSFPSGSTVRDRRDPSAFGSPSGRAIPGGSAVQVGRSYGPFCLGGSMTSAGLLRGIIGCRLPALCGPPSVSERREGAGSWAPSAPGCWPGWRCDTSAWWKWGRSLRGRTLA